MIAPCTAILLVHRDTPVLWSSLSALKWCEHIMVVDNDSKIDVARLYDAGVTAVFAIPGPIQDFAAVRNLAMEQVTTPWCFFCDSDEVVDPLSTPEQTELVTQMANPQITGMSVKRSDYFLGKTLSYGEAGNRLFIRFMRPKDAVWSGKAHEVPAMTGQIIASGATITHYSHESINSFITDVSSYAKIIATEREHSPLSNLVQLLLYPPLKLLYDLVLLGAILDGWRGVIYSYCMALHSLLVRIYWYEKHTRVVSHPDSLRES